jgi:CheY-like chemotaxis protein
MPKILIVDDHEDLREILKLAVESRPGVEVLTASSGNEAIRVLKSTPDIDCVISDYQMSDGSGGDIFEYLRAQKSRTKGEIPFVLCTSAELADCREFAKTPPTAHLRKPFGMQALDAVMRRILSEVKGEYLRVRTTALRDLGGHIGDLYLKLSDDKYVKLFNRDEVFAEADFDKLADMRVAFIYMKAVDFSAFIDALVHDVLAIASQREIEPRSAFKLSKALHDLGSDAIRQFGLDERTQTLIQNSVNLTIRTVRSQPRLLEAVEKLELDLASRSENFIAAHSVLLAYVSCALSAGMGWMSEATFFKLGMAAFLHDVTLDNPKLARASTIAQVAAEGFGDEERVRSVPGMPSELDVILEQHHERPDGGGFPHRLDSIRIHPMACVLIAAEDLSIRYLDDRSPSIAGHLQEMLPVYPEGLFRKMLRAALTAHAGTL